MKPFLLFTLMSAGLSAATAMAATEPDVLPRPDDVVNFGSHFVLDGSVLVAGGQESAYVFVRRDDGHGLGAAGFREVAKLIAPDDDPDTIDWFGNTLAVDGDLIAVGASRASTGVLWSGAVYLYERQAASNHWAFVDKLVPNDPQMNARFGNGIDIEGDRIIVTATDADRGPDRHRAGAVYVFERDATGDWQQTQKLSPTTGGSGSYPYAAGVALSGNTLGVIRTTENVVDIYEFDGTQWQLVDKVPAPVSAPYPVIGTRLALEDDALAVAMQYATPPGGPEAAGEVLVYQRDNGVWQAPQVLRALNPTPWGNFGTNLRLNDGYLVAAESMDGRELSVFRQNADGVWDRVHTMQWQGTKDVAVTSDWFAIGANTQPDNKGEIWVYRLPEHFED